MIDGWYYLHVNGDLIFKQDIPGMAADIRESDLAVMLWPFDTKNRESVWQLLIEALACGANLERVMELATKWHCDDDDAQIYTDNIDAVLFMDEGQWCAAGLSFVSLQGSPVGIGDTPLEALAELCKNLGYKPRKTGGFYFADLLK